MRKVSILIGICLLAAVGLIAKTADLDPVMKQVGPSNAALQRAVGAGSAADVATEAAKLEGLFKQTEEFMKANKVADGAGWAKDASVAAGDAAKAAKAGNMEAATAAANKVKGTCKGCHDVHREQLPDKSFKFKP